ncbi:hypothetical protein HWV62_28336 [Athelia sp. TMB]|nr:hypothetical protein HWV62_28336 [Athelia sp. TMB]
MQSRQLSFTFRTFLPALRRTSIPTARNFSAHNSANDLPEDTFDPELAEQEEIQNEKRQRKTEWKRRQRGLGNGGNGCVAFHREKFTSIGPPAGGNGGRGGDVYFVPSPHLTSLSSVPRSIRAEPGGNGRGTWQGGRNAPATIVEVPLGTVVREISGDDPRRTKDEWEVEAEALEGLTSEERREKMRERRWVHFPRFEELNFERDAFQDAEASMVADDGTFEGSTQGDAVYDETLIEEERERELMESGAYAHAPTRNQRTSTPAPEDAAPGDHGPGHHFDAVETFRFTIADNPGLISQASENVGLGHSFLRSMERSLALVYVVDLSGPAPWEELRDLQEELEKYKAGMSTKARMVIANKADLLGGDGDAEAVLEAKAKLQRLEEYVSKHMRSAWTGGELGRPLKVVPVSAKYGQNLKKVVGLMKEYISEVRSGVDNSAVKEETRIV